MPNNAQVLKATSQWLEKVVIDLNLCPFAKREWLRNKIRITVSSATSEQQLLDNLKQELQHLSSTDDTETTLLVHPEILNDFYDYNEFLSTADDLLTRLEYIGIFQIASFHPDYQFENTEVSAAENFTNKSPYPMLHILRESSVERAIASHPDTALIPESNIMLLKDIGRQKLESILRACSPEKK